MKFILPLTIVLFLFLSPLAVYAVPNGITLSPLSFNGNYRPGESAETSFTLTNNSEAAANLTLEAVELKDGIVLTGADSAAGWLSINPSQIELAAGASAEVKVELTITEGTALGAYYPAIVIKLANSETGEGTGTDINANLTFQLGVNITNEVPQTSIEIRGLTVTNPTLLGQATINYKIGNPLDLFIKPIAYLQVLNPQNQQIYTTTINESMTSLAAGGELSGTITVDLPLDIQTTGQYRVELLVIDQQFGSSEIAKTNFFVLPLWIPIGITVGITLIWTVLRRPKKAKSV